MATEVSDNLLKVKNEFDSVNQQKNYNFLAALRPFSLFIALSTTAIVWARVKGQPDFSVLLAALVVTGALLTQSAVNLINDWTERGRFATNTENYKNISKNFQIACTCFGVAAAIGIFIATIRGAPVIWLALAGFFACLAYTIEPFNLKRRGLGLLAVYLAMGPMLMVGSSYAMTGNWQNDVLLDSLVFAPLISLVLLANELRDYSHDRATTDKTFTVRAGFHIASKFFLLLIVSTVLAYLTAILTGHLQPSPVLLVPFFMALFIVRFFLRAKPSELKRLPQLCGRLVLATGTAHIIALLEI